MRPVHRRSQHRQRGTALIEMAIVLPLLTLLLIGIVNMGLLIREQQVLQNAAREGARYSALQANRIDEAGDATAQALVLTKIKTRVQRYLAQERITIALSDVTIDQNYNYAVDASTVTASQVTVSYSRSMLFSALAIDTGILYSDRTQSQRAADAAALAGAFTFVADGNSIQPATAEAHARATAVKNTVGGVTIDPAQVAVCVGD